LQEGFSAVVYWGISRPLQDNPAERHYEFMYDGKPGPLFHVARGFFRFIRPGAVRIGCTSSDVNVWAIAFTHQARNIMTIVLLNNGNATATASINNQPGIPEQFDVWQTSPTQNSVRIGAVGQAGTVSLPVKSVTTLYNAPAATPVISKTDMHVPVGSFQRVRLDLFGLDGRRIVPTVRVRAGVFIQVSLDENGAAVCRSVKTAMPAR